MARADANELRDFLLDEHLPGAAYILIWGEVEEGTTGHSALSQVLFAQSAVDDPDDAPVRDLSDPRVRAGVVQCALTYPEVAAAATKLLRRSRKPWWRFW
jgi:hypothetical protein